MKTMTGALILFGLMLAMPQHAAAQEERWTPWLGCWTLVDENTHEGAGAARASLLSPPERRVADPDNEPRTCVAPAPNGVTITTTVPGQAPTEQTLAGDGVDRPVVDDECRGTERTSWSSSGRLLFARADVTCPGESPRSISGLGMITTQGQWLDVRTFRIDGSSITRVSRYDRLDGTPPMGRHLTVDEIKEASGIVAAPVIEAAIAETRPPLTVKSDLLLELADAQVAPSVIDVMVAVAYPREFIVEPPSQRSSGGGSVSYGSYGLYDPFFDVGFWPSYYYSPFAYGYIGRYNPVLFPPYASGGGGSADTPVPPRGTGRAINGEGYTRVRPNSPAQPVVRGGDGFVTRSSSGSSSSGSSSSGGASSPAPSGGDSGSSSGGGGGGASPGGYSSGGSDSGGGGGGGRTAQPR